MSFEIASFVTSGDIAEALGCDASQVRHVLASRPIKPIGRAGLVRIYPAQAIEQVRVELEAIDRRRQEARP